MSHLCFRNSAWKRQAPEHRTMGWDAARGLAELFGAAGSWSGSRPEPVQAVAPPKSDSRITIERAINHGRIRGARRSQHTEEI
jgi:hypothetical protein